MRFFKKRSSNNPQPVAPTDYGEVAESSDWLAGIPDPMSLRNIRSRQLAVAEQVLAQHQEEAASLVADVKEKFYPGFIYLSAEKLTVGWNNDNDYEGGNWGHVIAVRADLDDKSRSMPVGASSEDVAESIRPVIRVLVGGEHNTAMIQASEFSLEQLQEVFRLLLQRR